MEEKNFTWGKRNCLEKCCRHIRMWLFILKVFWEKCNAFLNSFHPKVKQVVQRLKWIKDRIGRLKVSVLFNQTCLIYVYIIENGNESNSTCYYTYLSHILIHVITVQIKHCAYVTSITVLFFPNGHQQDWCTCSIGVEHITLS